MNFRTAIPPLKGYQGLIDHSGSVITIGSCFADSIGDMMLADGFDVEVNPLGTLYNPLSILNSLENLARGKVYTPDDFFEHEGRFRSFDFHSIFSRPTAPEAARMVNEALDRVRRRLPHTTAVMLTFGSARCFRLASTGAVVANCHKQHPALFRQEAISPEVCFEAISECVALLQRICPALQTIILTVSPIRHKAYGLHADKISKASLLLSVERVCSASSCGIPTLYFPSYEIMMDDLRDYRFYAADMVHPSDVAVEYIYGIFSQSFYSAATAEEAARRLKQFRRSLHRPENSTST